jgi:hypothetical protein
VARYQWENLAREYRTVIEAVAPAAQTQASSAIRSSAT